MGKKSQPAPVPPPNPYETIGAEANINRIDQYTPYGNTTYSGPNNTTQTTTLSPELQNLFNSQMGLSQGVLNQAQQGLGQLPQSSPYSGFGIPGQTGPSQQIPGIGVFMGQTPQAPNMQSPYAQSQEAPNLQTNTPGLGQLFNPQLQQSVGGLGQMSNPNLQQNVGGLDFSKASAMPQNYEAYRNDAEKAFFDRSAGLLNQQFGRDEDRLRQTLANQGLQSGGQAFGNEFGQFNQRRNEAYGNLANDAVLFGGQEASRGLADQLSMRNQGVNEGLSQFNAGLQQGNFTNQAMQNQAGIQNQNALSQFNAGLQQGGFANQSQLDQAGVANQNALNQFNAGQQQGNFANQSLINQFGLGTDIRNQNLQNQQFQNDTAQQNFANQQIGLQNQFAALDQNNNARSQLFNETGAARQTQFNELASLLGLQQVQPQAGSGIAPSQVGVGDAFGAQQAALQNNYNTQSANNAAKKGSTAQLGGTLGSAAMMAAMMSDRRLKASPKKIGQLGKHNVYLWTWNKIAEKVFGLKGLSMGVMADEVPQKFVTKVKGYLAVNYGALQCQ